MDDWHIKAQHMVTSQLKSRDIHDPRILDIMASTPRHNFVLDDFMDNAYSDFPLPLPCKQTISQPYVVAVMTQELDVQPTHTVLEIGTGSGYQTSILAQLAQKVYSVDIHPELLDTATQRFDSLGYTNIETFHRNGFDGFPDAAPFDRIIVTASPEDLPHTLVDQLAIDGIMIIPIGTHHQLLYKVRKCSATEHTQTPLIPVRFVPLVPSSG